MGPELPKPMAGHCQILVNNDTMFIYGGINRINATKFSNEAWLYNNETGWRKIPATNPCPNMVYGLPLVNYRPEETTFRPTCAYRLNDKGHKFKGVVIETIEGRMGLGISPRPCFSILNLNTYEWQFIEASLHMGIGGFLFRLVKILPCYVS